ncbi:hypothetical protein E1B28_002197 [Marasmius oreades]|uniref:Uncharacterized protein n=1 Tax=Marasmius oreades TaxID=181124 RepID=A0A9P7RMU2_9AGAR|nr:uncharacterized protein E1B28_002197 [Marasmius oreades]KAG7086227.1 hypothetical protein E1B28_002197 [Marasmius oreades]
MWERPNVQNDRYQTVASHSDHRSRYATLQKISNLVSEWIQELKTSTSDTSVLRKRERKPREESTFIDCVPAHAAMFLWFAELFGRGPEYCGTQTPWMESESCPTPVHALTRL